MIIAVADNTILALTGMSLKHKMKTVFSIFFTVTLLFMGNATAQTTFESLSKNFFRFKTMSADYKVYEQYFNLDGSKKYESDLTGHIYINLPERTFSTKYSSESTINGGESNSYIRTLYPDRTLKVLVTEKDKCHAFIKKTNLLPSFTELFNASAMQESFLTKIDPENIKIETAALDGEQVYKVSCDFFNLYFSKQFLLLKSESFFWDEESKERKLGREAYAYNYSAQLKYPFPEKIIVKNYFYPSGKRSHIYEIKFDLSTAKFDENMPLIDVVFPLGCTVIDENDNIYKVTDATGSNTPEENMVNMLEKLIEDSKN